MSDRWDLFWHEVYVKKDPRPQGPHGWIQWKGTDICIDLHCKCGYHGHIDGEFFYYYECPSCKTRYAVGQHVILIELTPELISLGEIEDGRFHSDKEDYERNRGGA